MNKTLLLCALSFSIALSMAPLLRADVITLDVTVTTDVYDTALKCSVKAANNGDEDARDVQAEVELLGEVLTGEKVPALSPNESYSNEFKASLSSIKTPGRYPVIVTVRFTDANGHPFSSVTCSDFHWKEHTTSGVFGGIKDVKVSDSSTLRLKLSNIDEEGHDLKIRILSPKEFTVKPPALQIGIGGRGALNLKFRLGNFSALVGSTHPIFATCEYEELGRHYLAILNGTVSVIEKPILGKIGEPIIFALIAAAILGFIILQLKRLLG